VGSGSVQIIPGAQHWPSVLHCSVVDPESVGPELLARYGSGKLIPDPDTGNSGSEMNLK